MKRPKVNPVFEGRGRKRSKGESSRSARMTARGRRTNGVRATRALAINPENRSMVTRSMAIYESEERALYEVYTIQAPVEQTNDDNKPTEQVQQQPEVVPLENKGDAAEPLVLDDLPEIRNFEIQVLQQQPVDEVVPLENKESFVLDDLQVQVVQQQPVDEVVPVENKGDDQESLPKICNYVVQVPQELKPVDEVVPMENKGDYKESLVLDDLPKICNYEVQVPQQLQPVDEVVPEENKVNDEESLVLDDLLKISNYEFQVPQQEQEPVVEVVPIENKGDDKESLVLADLPKISNPEAQVSQQQEEEQPVNEVVPVENKGDGEESLVLDDLPVICNYEEAWPCFNDGNGYGWNSYWDPTNDIWEPFGGINFEPVWNNDLWNFKDNNDTKKL